MKSRHSPWVLTAILNIVWCLHSSSPSLSDREQHGNWRLLLPVNKQALHSVTCPVTGGDVYLSQSSRQTATTA